MTNNFQEETYTQKSAARKLLLPLADETAQDIFYNGGLQSTIDINAHFETSKKVELH